MKKLLLLPLLFLSLTQANADQAVLPLICKETGWAEIFAQTKTRPHSYTVSFCVLPNGDYYSSWELDGHKEDRYKELFKQYLGQYPSFEQIEKAKEQIRKEGYTVD